MRLRESSKLTLKCFFSQLHLYPTLNCFIAFFFLYLPLFSVVCFGSQSALSSYFTDKLLGISKNLLSMSIFCIVDHLYHVLTALPTTFTFALLSCFVKNDELSQLHPLYSLMFLECVKQHLLSLLPQQRFCLVHCCVCALIQELCQRRCSVILCKRDIHLSKKELILLL